MGHKVIDHGSFLVKFAHVLPAQVWHHQWHHITHDLRDFQLFGMWGVCWIILPQSWHAVSFMWGRTMQHYAVTAESSAMIDTRRCFLRSTGLMASRRSVAVGFRSAMLCLRGMEFSVRPAKGCYSGIIDEVVNADGSVFASLYDDLLSTKRRSPGRRIWRTS